MKDLLLGDLKSLEALQTAKAVRVPRPIKVVSSNNTMILVTEYIQFSGLRVFQGELGHQLAMYFIFFLHHLTFILNNLNILLQTSSKELGIVEE